jgi:hypothetical protein
MGDYLVKAILRLRPNSQFKFIEDKYETIEWFVLEGEAPTKKEIDAAIKAIKAEEANQVETDATRKAALLDRLGITEDEAKLLLA